MAGLSSIRAKVKSCSHALNRRMRAHDARDGIRVFRGLSLPYSAESVLLPRTHEEQERLKQEADIQRFQMFLLPIKFQFSSFKGSKKRTSNDISISGMKRPHEMMNPISKFPFSISAVRRRAGERRNIRKFHLFNPPFFKIGR